MKELLRKSTPWLAFYALTLVAAVAVVGLLSLLIGIPNWFMTGVAVWFLVCFASLCFPDGLVERWMHGRNG